MSRILILCVLVGVIAGLGSYTFHYAAGTSYFSSNPAACVNCHIMREQYDGWQKASHHSVASCNDCHTPHALIPKYLVKAENGFWHSKAFTLQDFHEPIRIRPRTATSACAWARRLDPPATFWSAPRNWWRERWT